MICCAGEVRWCVRCAGDFVALVIFCAGAFVALVISLCVFFGAGDVVVLVVISLCWW